MDKLSYEITSILDKLAPIKVFQSRQNYAPWLSLSTKNWMKLRDEALDKSNMTRNVEDYAKYKKLRNHVNNLLKTKNKTGRLKRLWKWQETLEKHGKW